MPVEIRELVIRTVVTSMGEGADDETVRGAASLASKLTNAGSDQDAVVQECVRQVLRILRKERER